MELAFADLERGQTLKAIPVDAYRDRVMLRRVITDGESDVSFEFSDSQPDARRLLLRACETGE